MKKYIIIGLTALIVLISTITTYFIIKNKNSNIAGNKFEYYKNGYLFKKETITTDYYDIYGCFTELGYTDRYYLYELYKFLKLPKEEQKNSEHFNISDMGDNILFQFFDVGKQYKIADDFCIDFILDENSIKKVQCEKRAIPIESLPFERASIFMRRKDNRTTYYVDYDIKNLWKEFDSKGLKELENEIERESDRISKWHNANCHY